MKAMRTALNLLSNLNVFPLDFFKDGQCELNCTNLKKLKMIQFHIFVLRVYKVALCIT